MTTRATTFDQSLVAGCDEPVQRYFKHALKSGGELVEDVEIEMSGRIKVGPWLSFSANQEFHGHEFSWRARAGIGRWKPLRVVDTYGDGRGSTEGHLFGTIPFFSAHDEDTVRAGAARGAAESIWVPASLLPGRGVIWRAQNDNQIIATVSAPPEAPEVSLEIDATGAVRSLSVARWRTNGKDAGAYVPFGGYVTAERQFGDVTVPSHVSVGWGFGTPEYECTFEAELSRLSPLRPAA